MKSKSITVKRYALLSGATYYPPPGFRALDGFYDKIEKASEQGKKNAAENFGWFQIVDMKTGKIVAGDGSGHAGLFGQVQAGP